jgi:sugar phosphate isomerase/epimerase
MTANFVAREAGFSVRDWGHGDRTTQEAFAPLETFAGRFDAVLGDAQALGFDTVDVWGAHLSTDWASDAHVEAAVEALARRGLRVATYATWVGPRTVERACELARALGTDLIGAGFSGEPAELAPALERHGVRLAVENHPERTPAELAAKIERGGGLFGATIDTGWWGTWGVDAARAIEELGTHVLHVHLKDVAAPGEPHESCRWGDGVVPIEECVAALRRIGYTGAISVEHEPYDHDPTDEIREMRADLERWLA